jgi:hypothetical protein
VQVGEGGSDTGSLQKQQQQQVNIKKMHISYEEVDLEKGENPGASDSREVEYEEEREIVSLEVACEAKATDSTMRELERDRI